MDLSTFVSRLMHWDCRGTWFHIASVCRLTILVLQVHEARRACVDRELESGGCNGNTQGVQWR